MKVFLSWSKPRSRKVAEALHGWLPQVIQCLDVFISQEMDKGAAWRTELMKELSETDVGIICLTPEILNEPWIHYEAGALAKKLADDDARVMTFDYQIERGSVPSPLGDFNGTIAGDHDDMFRMVKTINGRLKSPDELGEVQLQECFEMWWPQISKQLDQIPPATEDEIAVALTPEQMFREILSQIRSMPLLMSKYNRVEYNQRLGFLRTMNRAHVRFVDSFEGQLSPSQTEEFSIAVQEIQKELERLGGRSYEPDGVGTGS